MSVSVESQVMGGVRGRMAARLGREFAGRERVAVSDGGRYSGWASVVAGSEVRVSSFTAGWLSPGVLARRFVSSVRSRLEVWPDALVSAEREGDDVVFCLVRPVSDERGRRYAVTGLTREF